MPPANKHDPVVGDLHHSHLPPERQYTVNGTHCRATGMPMNISTNRNRRHITSRQSLHNHRHRGISKGLVAK